MKSWDEIVFGKKFILPHKLNNQIKPNEIGGNFNKQNNQNNFNNECEFLQSKHKIILISGPPGIGKLQKIN
jgi:hypothetical protein